MKPWKLEPARDLDLPLREKWKSLRRESEGVETLAHLAWGCVISGYLKVFHRLQVEGREHLPAQMPFVLVANHCSHLDALCLCAPLPWKERDRVFPIAAGDTFFQTSWSSAFAVGLLNALPMWRRRAGTQALHQLRERLVEEPCAYILFPEGTRSRTGQMAPFKAGLGMMVAGTNVPVVPCHLTGTWQAWPPDQKRPKSGKITLRIGPALHFEEELDQREGWERIAHATEAAVRALSQN